MSVKYRAHDTFFIRKGWLSKGMKNVIADPAVFVNRDVNPMDTLGIGANMVKALRYWLLAVGLTEEYRGVNNRSEQRLTPLGDLVHAYDPYIEELGTLWLLHYRLATNKEDATAWYFFFNEFRPVEFSRDDYMKQTEKYLRERDEIVADRSIEDDYNCIVNTYIPRIKLNPKKFDPEDNIDCPLGELGLIDIVSKKSKVYKKSAPKKDTLHPLILLAVILDQANGIREIRISEIQTMACNVGKVFNLDVIALTTLLYKLEILGLVKLVRTAGLDVIKIETNLEFYGCVREYYHAING